MSDLIDIVFSFDTTGSMSQCIRQVRRDVEKMVRELLQAIPNISIGVVAHGDYYDAKDRYVIKKCDLTRDVGTLVKFIQHEATDTNGGDWEECYELVLRDAQQFSWRDGSMRRLVMIGDAIPHPVDHNNPMKIDWKAEAAKLCDMKVIVYAVQCFEAKESRQFFNQLANITNGLYLQLNNFDSITHLVRAVCYKDTGDMLQQYRNELSNKRELTREVLTMINTLEHGLAAIDINDDPRELLNPVVGAGPARAPVAVPAQLIMAQPGRFQVCPVGAEKISIKQFVIDQRLPFAPGRGFYEMTKKEKVDGTKEIVLRASTGDFFVGDQARVLASAAIASGRASDLPGYKIFIQSTSYNRVLVPGTLFLYEMIEPAARV